MRPVAMEKPAHARTMLQALSQRAWVRGYTRASWLGYYVSGIEFIGIVNKALTMN